MKLDSLLDALLAEVERVKSENARLEYALQAQAARNDALLDELYDLQQELAEARAEKAA